MSGRSWTMQPKRAALENGSVLIAEAWESRGLWRWRAWSIVGAFRSGSEATREGAIAAATAAADGGQT